MNLDHSATVRKEFMQFPYGVDPAIQLIALCDWDTWSTYEFENSRTSRRKLKHKWEPGKGWSRIDNPFLLRISNDLLVAPAHSPEIPEIPTELLLDPETGDKVGEVPSYDVRMSEDEAEKFRESLDRLGKIMARLRTQQNEWQFLEIALGFFVKAFFAEGLQQLLWHITVLESLFGEPKETRGVTELLGARIASVLGNTNEYRKSIKQEFKSLYDFRSNLVHGKRDLLDQEIYVGHLRDARHLARRCLLWFLNYLDHILTEFGKSGQSERLPAREDILSVLDLDGGSRLRIKRIIESLPPGFPNVAAWDSSCPSYEAGVH